MKVVKVVKNQVRNFALRPRFASHEGHENQARHLFLRISSLGHEGHEGHENSLPLFFWGLPGQRVSRQKTMEIDFHDLHDLHALALVDMITLSTRALCP